MSDQSVATRSRLFGWSLCTRLGVLTGLRVVRGHLRRFWSAAHAGQSIAEIDAHLLRDIGLSEFAAYRAVAAMRGFGFAAAGLDTWPGLLGMHGSDPGHGGIRIVCISGSDAP